VTETYAYDAAGARVTRTSNGATIVTVADLWERTVGGATTHFYRFGADIIGVRRSDQGTRHLFSDHLGSVSAATTASGALVGMQHYDPWGRVRTGGIGLTARTFTGQRLDATGLLYYHARYYDPTLGRFISPDSIVPGAGALTAAPHDAVAQQAWAPGGSSDEPEQDGSAARSGAGAAPAGRDPTLPKRAAMGPKNPQTLNRYAAVLNNPLRYVDPTGHAVTPPDCPPVCAPEAIDISAWPTLAQEAAVLGCLLLGCRVDDQRERIVPPSPAERLADSVLGMGAPAGVIGNLFKKAGVPVADHFLHRLTERTVTRGISEEAALRAYHRGRLFYNPRSGNYIRYDSQTGVAVVVDKPGGGKAITVFEGNPSPDWTPVRWRYGK
jgi:RHS repeat-associated protein